MVQSPIRGILQESLPSALHLRMLQREGLAPSPSVSSKPLVDLQWSGVSGEWAEPCLLHSFHLKSWWEENSPRLVSKARLRSAYLFFKRMIYKLLHFPSSTKYLMKHTQGCALLLDLFLFPIISYILRAFSLFSLQGWGLIETWFCAVTGR